MFHYLEPTGPFRRREEVKRAHYKNEEVLDFRCHSNGFFMYLTPLPPCLPHLSSVFPRWYVMRYFRVNYSAVTLNVESNHGEPAYTCIYRFRVHGI